MRYLTVLLAFSIQCSAAVGQVPVRNGGLLPKEYSKEIALYSAKTFLMKQVLTESKQVIRFEMDPLAAASSGELTSLVYKCESQKKEGLILGFYGDRWNNAGVIYQEFSFLNLPSERARKMLNGIDSVIDENFKYITSESEGNNIYYQFEDMTILIWYKNDGALMRVLWNGFDSEWEYTAYKRTKKRLERKLN